MDFVGKRALELLLRRGVNNPGRESALRRSARASPPFLGASVARWQPDKMDSPTMNPLVRSGQQKRPAQPTEPLQSSDVSQCGETVAQWLEAHERGRRSFAVLTYLTDTATLAPWVLGLTAARHGMPLIVAGRGR